MTKCCIHCPHAETPELRHFYLEEGRKWLAQQPRLGDAAEIARPIVDALRTFSELFDGRARAMEFDYDVGDGYASDADDLIDTIDEVCAIVRAMVGGMLVDDNRSATIPSLIDPILRGLADTNRVADVRARNRYWNLVDSAATG